MLVIRMQRTGRKGHAQFRVVVQDSRRTPTSGRIVAALGNFDPHTKTANLDKEKASFYLEHGAQPSSDGDADCGLRAAVGALDVGRLHRNQVPRESHERRRGEPDLHVQLARSSGDRRCLHRDLGNRRSRRPNDP